MLTNEQIINILKNWTVEHACIYKDNQACLTLVNSTGEFQASVVSIKPLLSRFSIKRKIDDSMFESIYSIKDIPSDIKAEFEYLFEVRSKEWIKKELDRMLKPEGLDALL